MTRLSVVVQGMHSSFLEAIRSILGQGGIAGFYRGFSITLMREIPYAFIQFPLYEFLKVTTIPFCSFSFHLSQLFAR